MSAGTGMLRRVVVEVDFVRLDDNLAVTIVPARTADMMRALELTTVRAFDTHRRAQGIVSPAHVPLGSRDPVLLDSHNPPLSVCPGTGPSDPARLGCRDAAPVARRSSRTALLETRGGKYPDLFPGQLFSPTNGTSIAAFQPPCILSRSAASPANGLRAASSSGSAPGGVARASTGSASGARG